MAEEKEAPKPKYYSRVQDEKIESILENYHKGHEESAMLKAKVEQEMDWKTLYNTLDAHLAQHGKTSDGKYKYISYKDHKDGRKFVEDLVHKLALEGIKKLYGAEVAKVYEKSPDLLREYAESHLLRSKDGQQLDYNSAIEELQKSDNLLGDIKNPESMLGMITQSYISHMNSHIRKLGEYERHLGRPAHYGPIADFVDKKLAPHKFKVKRGTASQRTLLGIIGQSANPDFKPKKAKYLDEVKEPKK